ncbi:Hypothetical predicted protein [Mytilus galloprovincialis]|uniref:Integrase p58-like C-terminal domain-containing protein n=1 Tax=Mytilus galloprovincialis TaxID=29158 RepID=A0A8B6C5H7_MYTGA|nr:Hypothetical predicted protein [Mytilus galloprovincialis]
MGPVSTTGDDGIQIFRTCIYFKDTKFYALWKGGNFTAAGCDPQPDTEIQENRSPDDYVAHLQNKLKENHAFARKALKKVSIYQKKRYDLNAKKRIFKRGEAVWIYDPIRKKGVCSKLTPKWKGPFIIEKRIDDVTYRVKRSLRQPSTVYHVDRLALYQGRNVPSWASRFRRMMDLEEANNDQQLDKPVG